MPLGTLLSRSSTFAPSTFIVRSSSSLSRALDDPPRHMTHVTRERFFSPDLRVRTRAQLPLEPGVASSEPGNSEEVRWCSGASARGRRKKCRKKIFPRGPFSKGARGGRRVKPSPLPYCYVFVLHQPCDLDENYACRYCERVPCADCCVRPSCSGAIASDANCADGQ
ncbi:hypothetical protein MRX96_023558 [Rhipicephalus microplus]